MILLYVFLFVAVLGFWYQSIQRDRIDDSVNQGVEMLRNHSLKIYVWETICPFRGVLMQWNMAEDRNQSYKYLLDEIAKEGIRGYTAARFKSFYLEQIVENPEQKCNREIVQTIVSSVDTMWKMETQQSMGEISHE